jgi:lysophospholipase L1-like esterase
MTSPAQAARPPRTWKKRLTVSAVSLVAILLVMEVGARVGSWLVFDRNPYYLFYGFVSWTSKEGDGHSDLRSGYFKFPAHQVIQHGLPEPGHINSHGFRGPEFATEKPDGTFRVVCMGGSSTFGYTNTDRGTYPVLLQQRFDADAHGQRVEVINAGIPHFNTDHLVAALDGEILQWSPDVLTLYCAYNDATYPVAETRFQRVSHKIDEYSAAFATFRKLLNKSMGEVLFHRWSGYPRMTPEKLAVQVDLHREMTRSNLEAIAARAKERGIRIVVVRQPITLWHAKVERGLAEGPRPALSYESEVAELRARLESEGAVQGWEAVLLVHRAVLDEVDAFAARHGLPVVDNVALVDAHPDALATYVHLTEEANARLADALYAVLAPLVPAP